MNPSLTDSRRQALRSASHWYAVLSGERVSPQQEARWQQWYEQDQDNQWAGSRLKTCATSWRCAWRRCQPGAARYPPHPPSRDERITAVARRWRRLATLAVRKPAKVCGQITAPQRRSQPSATGRWLLLTLNTQSAADVRFDAHQRTVRLWYGEIAITTAKDAQQRPSAS